VSGRDSVRSIRVETGKGGYDVEFGSGLLSDGSRLAALAARGRLVVVSDRKVWHHHGAALEKGLRKHGVRAVPLLVTPGERSKSWRTLEKLTDRLLALGVERGETILAFGGGVVGDLAGFAAAILKRGCPFVQVPTTLLAQVDSSVGGKTGINSRAGKNLVGAFHQPSAVLIDTDFLRTLPLRQRRNGWAEIVKYGLIADEPFFAWCERNGSKVIAGDADAALHAIWASIAAKAAIVAADEQETNGIRALLNFGHTFGHALEAETGFSSRLLHGEAVALGMVLALAFSAALGLSRQDDADRLARHFAAVGLPASLRQVGLPISAQRFVAHMHGDKKAKAGKLVLVLSRGIGKAFVENNVDERELLAFLAAQGA
jgi:3-dehydroquinate synthase